MKRAIVTAGLILCMGFNSYAYTSEYEFVQSEVGADYIEVVESSYSSIISCMGQDEEDVLKVILACEAQTEGLDGERAVLEVIFNRVNSSEWPNTVYDVLSQRGQFSTWKNRNNPYNTPGELEDEALNAVATGGDTVLPSNDYVYFATKPHSWMHDVIKMGNHYFGR